MSGTPPSALALERVEGVFVLGMYESGVELTHSIFVRMGLRSMDVHPAGEDNELARFNLRLLEALGGSRRQLPDVSPREAVRMLGQFEDEARQRFLDTGDAFE